MSPRDIAPALGVSKAELQRWRQLAEIPDETFEDILAREDVPRSAEGIVAAAANVYRQRSKIDRDREGGASTRGGGATPTRRDRQRDHSGEFRARVAGSISSALDQGRNSMSRSQRDRGHGFQRQVANDLTGRFQRCFHWKHLRSLKTPSCTR